MISVCDKQKLEMILDQFMQSAELRRILAKAGIPESEPVKLSIKRVDTDMEVITDYDILTTSLEVPVAPTEIDFEREIKDFLDQAETDYGLLSALPKSEPLLEGTTRTTFECTFNSPLKTKTVVFSDCCNGACLVCP